MQHMMGIVVPLGIEIAAQVIGHVAVMLQHEMDLASRLDGLPDLGGHLVQPVGFGDGVHGIEAQSVEAIFV